MKRILLIDDDSEVRRFLRVALERAGYEVLDADNGRSGVELFRRTPADLVVTDIFMPEKEGIETIRELRGEFPEMKILAISGGIPGLDPEHYLSMARKLGADASLEKPFSQKQLLESINELLGSVGREDAGSETAR
jgi:DNA-binding response OmpR family regulator